MAKKKIQKNLTDADMLKGFRDEESFEEQMLRYDEGVTISSPKGVKKNTPKERSQEDFYREFLTEHVEAQIGKALLEIKMDYFKEGVSDFSIQVKKQGRQILLETAPKKVKR